MKLLSVTTARAIWLFDVQDMNPRGKSLFPDLIDWLKENYHFSNVPAPSDVRDPKNTQGLVFTSGDFQAREEVFISVDLTMFNDGLVGNTQSSTADTEAFLQDVIGSLCREFSLIFDPSMIRKKLYVSELTVRLDAALSRLNSAVDAFGAKIAGLLTFDPKPTFEFTGLSFAFDSASGGPPISNFIIERKAGAPFSEHRFFAKAPLRTEDHLRLLEEFEQLLS